MRIALSTGVLVTVFSIAVLIHLAAGDPKPLQIHVHPTMAFAPADVSVQIRLIPDTSDRWMRIETQSADGTDRASSWTLEGEASRRYYTVHWPKMGAGAYDVIARVGHADTTRATALERLQLVGP